MKNEYFMTLYDILYAYHIILSIASTEVDHSCEHFVGSPTLLMTGGRRTESDRVRLQETPIPRETRKV